MTLVNRKEGISLYYGDVLNFYEDWETPIAIVSDGPYGLASFPGDPSSHKELVEVYCPHVEAWSRKASAETTLWFWNTEVGWATIHPLLESYGWEYRALNIWDKGISHIAGNCNTQTMRKFPVVTEVCAHYVRSVKINSLSLQEWLRSEWVRSDLPMYLANEACGVKNAATRKYLTADDLWYFPPPEAFEAMASYVNAHGKQTGRPYFSLDGKTVLSSSSWAKMRAKFNCPNGVTNVWNVPAVRGNERVKVEGKALHMNQKPLVILDCLIKASTDEGDLIWEPFGGLCSTAIAARHSKRRCNSAEILPEFYNAAVNRLNNEV